MTRAQEHLIISGGVSEDEDKKGEITGDWLKDICSTLDLNPNIRENPKNLSIGSNGHNSNPSLANELRFTAITGENMPKLNSARIKLINQYEKEIAACDTINMPLFSKDIINTGADALSTFRHTVPVDNSHYVYSVTEILRYYYCPLLYYLKHIMGLQRPTEGLRPEPDLEEYVDRTYDDEIPGHELGNIAHQVLRRCHLSEGQNALIESVKREFNASGLDMDKDKIALVTNWVNSFYESDIGIDVVFGKLQKREASFIYKYQNNLIRGQIDLFYFSNKGLLKIIDYKANDISVKEIPEKVRHYQLQMQLYAKALEAIYGKKADETILYFLVPDMPMVIDTTEDSCKELYETLDYFFTSHKKGDFYKKGDNKCQWCEYETICQ